MLSLSLSQISFQIKYDNISLSLSQIRFLFICRDWVWTLFLWNEWIQAQWAQYNEFVESG